MANTQTATDAVSAFAMGEVEGIVTFSSRGNSEFRYRLTLLKSERIRVWVEGRDSKHQWYGFACLYRTGDAFLYDLVVRVVAMDGMTGHRRSWS